VQQFVLPPQIPKFKQQEEKRVRKMVPSDCVITERLFGRITMQAFWQDSKCLKKGQVLFELEKLNN
jgi:hypothetical protein